jgi:hypothetical protein
MYLDKGEATFLCELDDKPDVGETYLSTARTIGENGQTFLKIEELQEKSEEVPHGACGGAEL